MALRILLADPSITAQKMGAKILTAAGYNVVTASNGVAAIRKIAEMLPDIALLEVHMAGYSGVEVCRKMKAIPERAQMPILLTVGTMVPFDAGETIAAKADGMVTKPFDEVNLITAVENAAVRLRPFEPVASPPLISHSIQDSKGEVIDAQAQSEQSPPEWPSAKAIVSRQFTPEQVETCKSALVVYQAKTDAAAFSTQHDSEVCDVCGHTNRGATYSCEQCDVPLPSSMRTHGARS